MSKVIDGKLNRLYQAIPEGVALPSTWLSANSYTPQLVRKYVLSGWLVRLGSRVYARPGESVTWEGVLLGLQRLAGIDLHLGGISSLSRQGLLHYLPIGGESVIHLWGQQRAPGWLRELSPGVLWSLHHRRLFSADPEQGWVELPGKTRDWTLRCSAPERAILEVLSEVDETASSFTYAAELFESLTALRPSVVSALLRYCVQNKAKRLFLFLANYYDYPWLKHVDIEKVDLGAGKRMVTRGGRFDKRFLITVPESFDAG